jgi:hypothetical protein
MWMGAYKSDYDMVSENLYGCEWDIFVLGEGFPSTIIF